MITHKETPSKEGPISHFTLTNASDAKVVLSSLGAGIVEVHVPDANGKLEDVALGYANPTDYIGDGPACGKVPGRYANRIAKGRFSLEGKEYKLPINNGPNCNHGGPAGFHNRNWKIKNYTPDSVTFAYDAKDGEAGFPGRLHAEASYVWTDNNELKLTLKATTDAPTVVNLTNHAYWNLKGHNSGSVLDHFLQIDAEEYLPTDETMIPTGERANVSGTPMDFRVPAKIGMSIKKDFPALKIGKGYDSCWTLKDYKDGEVRKVVTLADVSSGRILEIETDQPGVQVYTGNWLSGSPINKAGRSYEDYDGVAIECQNFPNSPNTPDFPSAELKPGEIYEKHINFIFKNQI